MDRISKFLLIPAGIATAAGVGLDMTTNMLQAYWPDAPHWLVAALFWSGPALIFLPLPFWLIWLAWKNRYALSVRWTMIIGLAFVIGGCALGVIGLSIIAAGDRPVSKAAAKTIPAEISALKSSPLSHETFLGFSSQLNLEIRNVAELRRQFIFQNITPEKAKAGFYLSANDRFVFSITDIREETYTLDVPIGGEGIPIYRPIFLVCEAGIGSNETYMRILVDGVEIAERTLPYRVDLGSRNWAAATMGADAQGKQNSAFVVSTWSFGHVTLTDKDIIGLKEATGTLRSEPQSATINSNSSLRKRTSELTPRMRVFQEGATQAFTRLYAKYPQDPQQAQAFRESEAGKRYAQEQYELLNRYTAEADQQFRSEALALRDEMERRLGRLPPYPRERRTLWLDTNNMAGPSPFSWAADYLEELARRLPP
jgi:hypothetical protein